MPKLYRLLGLLGFCGWVFLGTAAATDPPHDVASCLGCHQTHNAMGAGLSKDSNANLCMSCHTTGGSATNKPFSTSMGADLTAGTGTSHSWSGTMPASDQSANPCGLRSTNSLSNSALKSRLNNFGNAVACSVCHDQHSQAANAWDPDSPAYGGAGTGNGRHMQRINNDLNQMCEDCHYYRVMSYTRTAGEDSSYPADGVNVFSHPVAETLNSKGYDKTVPLDYDGGSQQTAPRYQNSSATETPADNSNNLVLDASGRVRCLSCHRMHYVDANGLSEDAP